MAAPRLGEVIDGYRFTGGDPSAQSSWETFDNTPRTGDIIEGFRFKGGDPSSRDSWEDPNTLVNRVRDAYTVKNPAPPTDEQAAMGEQGMLTPPERTATPAAEPAKADMGLGDQIRSASSSGVYRSVSGILDAAWAMAKGWEQQPSDGVQVEAPILGPATRGLQQAFHMLMPKDEQGRVQRVAESQHLEQLAEDFAPRLQNVSFDQAAEKGEVIPWMLVQGASQSPQVAMLLATILAPALAPATLPMMGTSAAGNQYAENVKAGVPHDRAAQDAAFNGAVEMGSEAISFGLGRVAGPVFDKILAAIPDSVKRTAAGNLLARAAAMTGTLAGEGLGEGVSEATGQVLQDLSQQNVAGRDPGNMAENARTAFMGSLLPGAAFALPGAAHAATRPRSTPPGVTPPGAVPTASEVNIEGLSPEQAIEAVASAPVTPVVVPSAAQLTDEDVGLAGPSAKATTPAAEFDFTNTFPTPTAGENSTFADLSGPGLEEGVRNFHGDMGAEAGSKINRGRALDDAIARGMDVDTGKPATEKRMGQMREEAEAVKGLTSDVFDDYQTEFGPGARQQFERVVRDFYEGDRGARPLEGGNGPERGAGESVPGAVDNRGGGAAVVPPDAQGGEIAEAPEGSEDFTSRRGEVATFPTEGKAAGFAKKAENRVPRGYVPRQVAPKEWVLTRVKPERSPAQRANDARLARQRKTVNAAKDALPAAMGKLGGVRLDDLTRDGFDRKDAKLVASGVFGAPAIRTNGGMSLDAMTELLAQHGYDVQDEAGRPDASRLRDLIDDVLEGKSVYTPEGFEYWAQRGDEELEARQRAANLPDDDSIAETGYHDLSGQEQAAVDELMDEDLDHAIAEAFDGHGKVLTNEEADALFGFSPEEGQGDTGPASESLPPQGVRRGEEVARGPPAEQDVAARAPAPPAASEVTQAPQTPSKEGVSVSKADENLVERLNRGDVEALSEAMRTKKIAPGLVRQAISLAIDSTEFPGRVAGLVSAVQRELVGTNRYASAPKKKGTKEERAKADAEYQGKLNLLKDADDWARDAQDRLSAREAKLTEEALAAKGIKAGDTVRHKGTFYGKDGQPFKDVVSELYRSGNQFELLQGGGITFVDHEDVPHVEKVNAGEPRKSGPVQSAELADGEERSEGFEHVADDVLESDEGEVTSQPPPTAAEIAAAKEALPVGSFFTFHEPEDAERRAGDYARSDTWKVIAWKGGTATVRAYDGPQPDSRPGTDDRQEAIYKRDGHLYHDREWSRGHPSEVYPVDGPHPRTRGEQERRKLAKIDEAVRNKDISELAWDSNWVKYRVDDAAPAHLIDLGIDAKYVETWDYHGRDLEEMRAAAESGETWYSKNLATADAGETELPAAKKKKPTKKQQAENLAVIESRAKLLRDTYAWAKDGGAERWPVPKVLVENDRTAPGDFWHYEEGKAGLSRAFFFERDGSPVAILIKLTGGHPYAQQDRMWGGVQADAYGSRISPTGYHSLTSGRGVSVEFALSDPRGAAEQLLDNLIAEQDAKPKKGGGKRGKVQRQQEALELERQDEEQGRDFELEPETEAEIRAREVSQAKDAAAKTARDNAPGAEDFTLTGSNRAVDVARAKGQDELFDGKATDEPRPQQGTVTIGDQQYDLVPKNAESGPKPEAKVELTPEAAKVKKVLDNETLWLFVDQHPMWQGITKALRARQLAEDKRDSRPFIAGWLAADREHFGLSPDPFDQPTADGIASLFKPDQINQFYDGVQAYAETLITPETAPILDEGGEDVPGSSASLEPDRERGAGDQGTVGPIVQPPAAGPLGRAGRAGETLDLFGGEPAGGEGLPDGGAAAGGAGSTLPLFRTDGRFSGEASPAGSDLGEGRPVAGDEGIQPELAGDDGAGESLREAGRADDVKAQAQLAAQSVPVKLGDIENIREALPYLTEGQQDDVRFAEERFATENGFGVLFTNSTGTGKTFTGLGVMKRLERQGKTNIIVVTPNDKIIEDWIASGQKLHLDIAALADTQSNGEGVVVTTYANFASNRTLSDRAWDMVLLDESHYLLANKEGEFTNALDTLRAITKHPGGAWKRAEMIHRDIADRRDAANAEYLRLKELAEAGSASAKDVEKAGEVWHAAVGEFNDVYLKVAADVKAAGQDRSRVTLLSATPFPYVTSIDYAEGYLFSFDDWGKWKAERTGYNQPDARAAFYMQHFGFRMRTGKLTKPEAAVDSGLMERNFNSTLKRAKVLSGRILDVQADYDRKFILMSSAIGQKIDEGLEFLRKTKKYSPLAEYVRQKFDYLSRRFLLEAIKARESLPYIREHLAMGRKVVVFHDYKLGGGVHPFKISATGKKTNYVDGRNVVVDLDQLVADFERERPDLVSLQLDRLAPPIDVFKREFGNEVLIFNGDIPKGQRRKAVALFNDDESGKDLLLVQSAAGKEGISLHDRAGKHQRVLFNLGMPTQPMTAIQQEGRIYRQGQVSNALFRYFSTGTSWERWTFAGTIAERASTAENLALGEQARMLRQAFIDSYQEAADYRAGMEGEGLGGKEADRSIGAQMSDFERAKTYYFAQAKKTSRNKAQEGVDYFATPEPLALKMVEWANIQPTDRVLEPSAGHGAIARFFPGKTMRRMVEPSPELISRAKLNAPEVEAVQERFEDHDIHNKYDAIVMNPPFGQGGKTAMDHLLKAYTHLYDGGRIVALIPHGPAMDKRLEKILYEEDEKGRSVRADLHLVADIKLPGVTFERAGTQVRARIVVLEKQHDNDLAQRIQQVNRDYASAETTADFFDRIENASVPDRVLPEWKKRIIEQSQGAKFSRPAARATTETPAPAGVSHSAIRKRLYKVFGKRAIDALTDAGTLRIVNDKSDLPESLQRQIAESGNPNVDAIYDGWRTVYLLADYLDTKKVVPVMLHELGEHYGLEAMLGEEAYAKLLDQVRVGNLMRNPLMEEAWLRVREAYPNLEEGSNEFLHEVIARVGESAEALKLTWFQNLLQAVRNFLRRIGFTLEVTDRDLMTLVSASLRKVLDTATAVPRGEMRSMPLGEAMAHKAYDGSPRGLDPLLAWFGKSKMIDGEGKPLRLYHITRSTFDEFKPGGEDATVSGPAIWLAVDPSTQPAAHNVGGFGGEFKEGTNVMPVFARIERPLYVDAEDRALLSQLRKSYGSLFPLAVTAGGVAKIKADGYDGVVFDGDTNGMEVMAFDASQVKSAIGNNGTFDQRTSNIMASRFNPSGNATLDAARRKAGLVKDSRNVAERSKDYLAQGWDRIRLDIGRFGDALRQGALDRYHAMKLLEEGAGLPAEQSSYVAARLSTGVSSVMRGILMYGQPEWRDGIIQKKEGTKGLLDVLAPVKEEFDDWVGWMVGMRARRLLREGREHNLSAEEITELVKLGNGREERFLQVARDFAAFKRSILDLGEEAGLINPETRPVWDHADWIPFYRVGQDNGAIGPRGRKGLSGQTSGIRSLKGGVDALNDPLENILMNFSHLIGAAMKNVALDRALDLATEKEIAQKVKWDFKSELVPADQIRKALLEGGVPQEIVDTMPPEVFEGMRQMWAIQPPSDPDVVRVMRDGKAQFYRVDDPLLLRALTAMHAPERGWTKPFRAFKRVLTHAVTATPDFMLRNFIRDAMQAWTISEDHFKLGLDSIRGAAKSFTETGGMVDMMFAGGSFMGGYVNGTDPVATAAATRAALRKKGWSTSKIDEFMGTLVNPMDWWHRWQEIGSAIENANREAVFEAATREGKTKARAVFEAKDLMDYSMQGEWALFQILGDIVPFFNARLQGLYKLGRAITDDPLRVGARGMLLAVASAALMALNDQDPRYEELEEWDKDTYWHFWIAGKHLRVPKPFEIGVIFGTMPERLYRYGWGADKGDGKLLAKRVWWNLATNLNLLDWPQLVAPAVELYANKDSFTGRPIEGMSDEGKLPEARYSANTSDTMKALTATFPETANAMKLSPKKLEHLWHGYLGELGMYALGLSDIAVRALTSAPARPEHRADDLPVVKAFVREDPARATRWETELYDMHTEVDDIYRSVMAFQREGDVERAARLVERERSKLAARGPLTEASAALSQLHQERERVYRSRELTPAEKRRRLDDLQAIENDVSERVARATRGGFQ